MLNNILLIIFVVTFSVLIIGLKNFSEKNKILMLSLIWSFSFVWRYLISLLERPTMFNHARQAYDSILSQSLNKYELIKKTVFELWDTKNVSSNVENFVPPINNSVLTKQDLLSVYEAVAKIERDKADILTNKIEELEHQLNLLSTSVRKCTSHIINLQEGLEKNIDWTIMFDYSLIDLWRLSCAIVIICVTAGLLFLFFKWLNTPTPDGLLKDLGPQITQNNTELQKNIADRIRVAFDQLIGAIEDSSNLNVEHLISLRNDVSNLGQVSTSILDNQGIIGEKLDFVISLADASRQTLDKLGVQGLTELKMELLNLKDLVGTLSTTQGEIIALLANN